MVRYRKIVLRLLGLTLCRDGHGGGIASRKDCFVYRGPRNITVDCSKSPNGETRCHRRLMYMNHDVSGAKVETRKIGSKSHSVGLIDNRKSWRESAPLVILQSTL